jgi:hypothetical protein
MLFKDVIAVYSENYTKSINTKRSRWLHVKADGFQGLTYYFLWR